MEVSKEIENELMKLKNSTTRSENSSLKSGTQPPHKQGTHPGNSNPHSLKGGQGSDSRNGEAGNTGTTQSNSSGGARPPTNRDSQMKGLSKDGPVGAKGNGVNQPGGNQGIQKPAAEKQQVYHNYYMAQQPAAANKPQDHRSAAHSMAASPNPSFHNQQFYSPYPAMRGPQQAQVPQQREGRYEMSQNRPHGPTSTNSNFSRTNNNYMLFQSPGPSVQGSTAGAIHRPMPVQGYSSPDTQGRQEGYRSMGPYGQPSMLNQPPSALVPSTTQQIAKVPNQSLPFVKGQTAVYQNPPSEVMPKPILQNIVSTANLSCKLDLRKIALNCRNAEYNPKRFAAVIMRIREPKTTALIFTSGKMVCTGAKSEELSRDAAKKYSKAIRKVGFNVSMQDFKIQNIVGSCDVQFAISLEGLSSDHDKFSTYEPEIFPGLIYRMQSPKIVLLVFASGKIVLTGAKNKEDIYQAFNLMYPVLKKYKKKPARPAQQ